jgi:hypothetical protein
MYLKGGAGAREKGVLGFPTPDSLRLTTPGLFIILDGKIVGEQVKFPWKKNSAVNS